ncbi:MAG: 3D domain-containing protein [Coriobacteriia bacterium]|nr:3D domain-containing protein [Coriobacteriia bacterium]
MTLASLTGFVWADTRVTLVIDGESKTVTTQSDNVASLLSEAGVEVGQGDLVSPAQSATVSDDMVVVVRHAVPVTLKLGTESVSLRVLGRSVADALIMAGLDPTGGIHTTPAADARLQAGMVITATDVFFRIVEERVELPYSTIVQGDPALPAGARKVVSQGSDGSAVRVWQVLVTGGVEGQRSLKLTREVTPQVNEVVAVGTKSPFRQVLAPRKVARVRTPAPTPVIAGASIQVRTTAYTPWDSSCVGHNKPSVGFGWIAGKMRRAHIPAGWGIIAVDPHVIPLGSKVFVEGYGYAIACDTGGAIKGKKIDVCFWGADTSAPFSGGNPQISQARRAAFSWGARNGKRTIRVTVLGR